ncbi:MAG: c-type cytochrome [Candidatus Promineifilaceae bacterium]
MRRGSEWIFGLSIFILLICVEAIFAGPLAAAPANTATNTAVHPHTGYLTSVQEGLAIGECEVTAVSLMGAWVDAGAPDGSFSFSSLTDEPCVGDFQTDVQPLFTTENAWFEGSQACTECHFENSADSRHEMDLSSYAGILTGADAISSPPGVPILIPGDWENSVLRLRMRNNRMPPGWEFDIEETNRDGPMLSIHEANVYAVDLIGAWVDAGAPDGDFAWTDTDGAEQTGNFEADVLPLFTDENAWFEGSQACTECHFEASADSRHEMDLSSYAGILTGADALSSPPGVPILIPGDWENSVLRLRLRNNRMPPGWEFDIEETNRDGPTIKVGKLDNGDTASAAADSVLNGDCSVYAVPLLAAWVDAGAPETDPFPFSAEDGTSCSGVFETDILPFFVTEDAWFPGSQACTECHFENSPDSRHEMDLSTYAGILAGADVVSAPPGVPIIVAGDWGNSVLRARLRNNRMPPGWEFDIEETNRDGPLLTVDGGEVYAVNLVAAWVEAGSPDGDFAWTAEDGSSHTGTYADEIQPLFTEENVWFEGSQACTECHFENSADSRHEMDFSSYAGVMLGADVISSPPGVPVVVPGDWDNSVLRHRLRDNRMPPGWEFDIEETNRDGPLVMAGTMGGTAVAPPEKSAEVLSVMEAMPEPPPPVLPEGRTVEIVTKPIMEPVLLGSLGVLTVLFGFVMILFVIFAWRKKDDEKMLQTAVLPLFIFTFLAVGTSGFSLYAIASGAFSKTITIHKEVPFVVEVAPRISAESAARLEEWQAKLPEAYAALENPYTGDQTAVAAGKVVYLENDCQQCHGFELDGQGDFSAGLQPKPVNLTDPALMNLPFMTDAYLFWRVSEGGAQPPFYSAMPAWRHMLTDAERWQVVTYIRSQTAAGEADESVQAAVAIIEQAGCFACHRSEALGRGGKIGPGWDSLPEEAASRVAGLSAEEYIYQSIVDPQAFTVPGFEDQALTMPADLGTRLSTDEINILVNFILQTDDAE